MEILIIIVLMFFITWGIINNSKEYLKTKNYVKTKAKIIKTIMMYSEEWANYFPDDYKEALNSLNKLNSFLNSTGNEGVDSLEREDGDYTFLAEYDVNGEKYYYYEKFMVQKGRDRNPFKNDVGKEIEIYYNPSNPKENARKSSSIKSVIGLVLIDIIFLALIILILNK